ncbi:purine-nucleoside phosphorylase [Endomicrobium proavitum]|uniref:Purine nucleoside phosphorylase n=1 Tax=Endomicrobium proavitum TaxID=1408281 RepID=A0A0G3WG75_9BACT|nr:purine-nucleoside phosphorylase [Endomicrobium proavitum]AKL97636.1 Purine nucleoside phosphorylase 1 [Endomicrobium proavitum]
MNTLQKIARSKKIIEKTVLGFKPEAAIITGSGFSGIKNKFTVVKTLPYSKIPFFPKTTVAGHPGEINFCSYKSKNVLIFNGRFHLYEGFKPEEIIYPVRVAKALEIKSLIITCAVGGLNKKYKTGDIVIIKDQINFTGENPFCGAHFDGFGERFPDVSAIYDKDLRKKALSSAKKFKIRVHEGVYLGVTGSAYETPAEVKAYVKLGGDIIGMSVVFEAAAAAQTHMKVLGLSSVSDAAGTSAKHDEVLKSVDENVNDIAKIVQECLL